MDVASLNRMAQRASRRRASCAGGGHPAAVASTTTAATVFHDFLVKTFPAETQAGSTIVDVAGGQGDLAWLLCNANKCNAAVLDPLGSGEGQAGAASVPVHGESHSSGDFNRDKQSLADMQHQQHQQNQQVCGTESQDGGVYTAVYTSLASSPAALSGAAERAAQWLFDHRADKLPQKPLTLGALPLSPPFVKPLHLKAKLDRRLEDDPVVNFVRSAGLIAGFHPDQATEACVDLALSLQLPFAVCTCCVFPDEFPQRRLDSKPVLVYAQLLEYLKRKHPNTRTATLPEFGTRGGSDRRTVVFMLRSDYTDAD
eukprot:gene6193-23356_t